MHEEAFRTIHVERKGSRCYVTLNRPRFRNALTVEMVSELASVLDALQDDSAIHTLIVRGAGGYFCAGGDIKSFRKRLQGGDSATQVASENREIGRFLTRLNQLPQTVVMLVEGAAIGGDMGLVCVSDIALATADTRFALSETSLGLPPAQIAAFVVQRIGLTQARRLMMTAARFKGDEAEKIGLVHFSVPDSSRLEQKAAEVLQAVERCGPQARRFTKEILHRALDQPLAVTLDRAAQLFASAMLSEEGREGVQAFIEKRQPGWVPATHSS